MRRTECRNAPELFGQVFDRGIVQFFARCDGDKYTCLFTKAANGTRNGLQILLVFAIDFFTILEEENSTVMTFSVKAKQAQGRFGQ